jgi:hypothetical protein
MCHFIWQRNKNFNFLSAKNVGWSTLTKKARGERVTCYDKLHSGAEEGRIAELLIRTFSPSHFQNKLNFLLRCQIKRQNISDPEDHYNVERRPSVKLLTSAIVVLNGFLIFLISPLVP